MALIDRSTINDKVEDAPVRIPNVAVPNVESDSEKWLAYHKKGNRVAIYEKRDYIPASTASQNVLELHYGKEQPTESAKKDDREYVKETAIKTEQKEVMGTQEASRMAERIRHGRFFGTLNELTASEKEAWHNWTRSPVNRVLRALSDGSYAKMKGYNLN